MARKKGREADSRSALVDAAWALLLEQGARGLSVEAIVNHADLSKGTFFHFFPTKMHLLDTLCDRIADASWQHSKVVLQRTDLDPVARFDLLLHTSRIWRSERAKAVGGIWWELARDENVALMSKIRALGVARMAPAMASLFIEANERGLMHLNDVDVVAELVVEWSSATVEGTMRLLGERRDADAIDLGVRRANATLAAIERVLGIADGSLRRVERQVVSRIAADIPGRDAPISGGPNPAS